MCATRLLRISAANIGPKRFHQNRTVSWLISIPRSASRSSTLRSDSGYLTYSITTRRMTSGEYAARPSERILWNRQYRCARNEGRLKGDEAPQWETAKGSVSEQPPPIGGR